MERWATFDCYGTLIDWDGGVRAELVRVFDEDHADELLARYHELEPDLQRDGKASYRDVLTESANDKIRTVCCPGWAWSDRGTRQEVILRGKLLPG